MTPPNLFSFATSELTQDAFLAYLIAWANPAVAHHDPAMHRAGTAFLQLLLDLHGKLLKTIKQLEVRAQVKNIDVLVYLETEEENYTLVIEDKVHAGSYNNLRKYLEAAKSVYPKAEPLGIYLRTGNQADYAAIEEEKFRVVNRRKLLDYLQDKATGNPPDTIFQNYRRYLEDYQAKIDAYRNQPVSAWDGNAWVGFFSQVLLPNNKLLFDDYGYVANAQGGFQGCWWIVKNRPTFRGYSIYLQIDGSNTREEESYLKVKIQTYPSGKDPAKNRERIHIVRALAEKIQASPSAKYLGLEKPRLRAGQWMTAAVLELTGDNEPRDLKKFQRQLTELQRFVLAL